MHLMYSLSRGGTTIDFGYVPVRIPNNPGWPGGEIIAVRLNLPATSEFQDRKLGWDRANSKMPRIPDSQAHAKSIVSGSWSD